MELLFNGDVIFVFFFAMIAIYNYSDLKEYQRISIIYITVYSLMVTKIIGVELAIMFLILTMFCVNFIRILALHHFHFLWVSSTKAKQLCTVSYGNVQLNV